MSGISLSESSFHWYPPKGRRHRRLHASYRSWPKLSLQCLVCLFSSSAIIPSLCFGSPSSLVGRAGCLNQARVIQQISFCSSLQGRSTWQQDDSTDYAFYSVLKSTTVLREARQQSAKIPHSSWEINAFGKGHWKSKGVSSLNICLLLYTSVEEERKILPALWPVSKL